MKAVCGVSCLKGCRMSRPLGVSCTNFKHYSAQQTIDTASLKPFTPFCLIKKCMVTMKQGNTNYLKLLYNFKKGFLKVMSIILSMVFLKKTSSEEEQLKQSKMSLMIWPV